LGVFEVKPGDKALGGYTDDAGI
jgi:hypothetical protein